MGVKDLNNIVRKSAISYKDIPTINTLIIDGSNMIITYLLGASSDMIKNSSRTCYDTVNNDMLHQMKYIIQHASSRGIKTIAAWIKRYNPSNIYFVQDPKSTVEYTLSSEMDINDFVKRKLFTGSTTEVKFNLKSDEQEARKKAASKKPFVIEKYDKLKDEYDVTIANLFRQSFQFSEPCNVMSLGKIVGSMICMEIDKMYPGKLHIVAAEDEADLVIKNIGEMESKNGNVLICSIDTDYFVLFAGNANIYVTGLNIYDKVYSPIQQWRLAFTVVYTNGNEKQLIEDSDIFDYVIRLAPLFGNDYNRNMVISAKKYENCLIAFYPCITTANITKRSGIGHLISTEKAFYDKNVISIEKFDEMMYDYTTNHKRTVSYTKYLYSVFVYKNYTYFNRWHEINDEIDIDMLLKEVFDKWCSRPDPDNKYNEYDLINAGKYETFYTWDTAYNDFTKYEEIPRDFDYMLELYKDIDLTSTSLVNIETVDDNLLNDLFSGTDSDNASDGGYTNDSEKGLTRNKTVSNDLLDTLLDDID